MKKEIPTFITFAFLLALAESQGKVNKNSASYNLLWNQFEKEWKEFTTVENMHVSPNEEQ